jgi:chemotaxis protein MotB
VNISNLSANVEQQARALEDYKQRADQLDQIKKRFELLRDKLQSLTKLGLSVTVRNNRMVIQLPGDVLFDSGKETLKKDGEDILRKVANVIRGDKGWRSARSRSPVTPTRSPSKGGASRTTGASAPCARARCSCSWSRRQDKGWRRPLAFEVERAGLRRHRSRETQRHARKQAGEPPRRARRRPQRAARRRDRSPGLQ